MKNNLDYLLSPVAIRDKAREIFDVTVAGKGHFRYHPERLNWTVDYVLSVIEKNYPDNTKIPFHSRWGHFRVGGVDRSLQLNEKLKESTAKELARTKLDLAVTSVLLDAGAGDGWSYLEKESGKTFNRSEGLGVASFYLFLSGKLASDHQSLCADKDGLQNLSRADLEQAFQVTAENPLIGVEGRLSLLNNLANALQNRLYFRDGRPGNILDYLIEKYGKKIPATGLLRAVLDAFGPIWPGRESLEGVNLGDVWPHSQLGLVPFHKLSQWMSYSLIEPIVEAGIEVEGVEGLTGLAEYRNGGLLIDAGLISFSNPSDAEKAWAPGSDLVIEWRALTVHLLDIIGTQVQERLGKKPSEFPLAKVLEGGTWWAGRFLAADKRVGGGPPLRIQSDGTVF